MATVIIVIHLMVVLAMIGLILLQRSEGGALGIGGGQNAFLTGRSAGNVLSHTTAYLAIAFFVTSLGLALLAKFESRPSDILERLPGAETPVSTETPSQPAPAEGAPTSAEDLLRQLGGTSGGPQTPPATDGTTTPAPSGEAAPAPADTQAPAPSGEQAPAPAPAAETTAPAPAAETPAASSTPAPPPASDSVPAPQPAPAQQ